MEQGTLQTKATKATAPARKATIGLLAAAAPVNRAGAEVVAEITGATVVAGGV